MKQVIDGLDNIIETLANADVMDDYPDFTNKDVLELTTIYQRCEQFIAEYDRLKKANGFGNMIATD